LLTDLKEIAGTLRHVENQLMHCKTADDALSVNMVYSVEDRVLIKNFTHSRIMVKKTF